MNEDKKIPVSVIVPVHNSIEYLPMTIESLLSQTLENIEIIFVENSSTDGAAELLDDYARKYENIIVKHIPEQKSPSPGRNLGKQIAHGEFIYFCDSDDYVYPDALQRMYDAALISGAELVLGAISYTYDDARTIITRNPYKPGMTKTQFMNKQFCSVWEKLVKKTLLDRTPEFMHTAFEDVMWSYQVTSLAEKIIYVRKPVYLWYRRMGSISNTYYSRYAETIAESEDNLLKDFSPEYLDSVIFFMARRAKWHLSYRWYISDIQIASIKRFWHIYKQNKLLQDDLKLYNFLEFYADLSDKYIPQKIYINNFTGINDETKNYFINKSFRYPCEVVLLSEKNCNVAENNVVKNLWEKGEMDQVGLYFAAKEIFQNGGIYCCPTMRFNAPLNCLLHWNSLFSFSTYDQISDCIFGGKAGEDVFAAILETYDIDVENQNSGQIQHKHDKEVYHEDDVLEEENEIELLKNDIDTQDVDEVLLAEYEEDVPFVREKVMYMDENASFVERLNTVLFDFFNVKQDGETRLYRDNIHICSPTEMMYDLFPPQLDNDATIQISWSSKDISVLNDGCIQISERAIEYYRKREVENRKKIQTLNNHLRFLKHHKFKLTKLLSKKGKFRQFLKKTPLFLLVKFLRRVRNRLRRMKR